MSEVAQVPSRRSKHRKEVKRYYQRQQNRLLRSQAKSHDDQLFLFGQHSLPVEDGEGCEDTSTHDSSTQAPPAVARGVDSVDGESETAITKPLQPAMLLDRSAIHGPVDGSVSESKAAAVGVATLRSDAGTQISADAPAEAVTNPLADNDEYDNWNFEFVFRSKQRPDADSFDGAGDPCTLEHAIVPSSFYTEMDGENDVDKANVVVDEQLLPVAEYDAAARSLVSRRQDGVAAAVDKRAAQQSAHAPALKAVLPVASGIVGPPPKAPNSIHVQRVEGVPALPTEGPLQTGTDINVPTTNYLTLDPTYNLHQHAPGFSRNEKVAMRSLLSNAFLGWSELRAGTVVLSTGDALRAVFQQAYTEGKGLALTVQRIGPTLIVDTQREQPSSVREMRAKSLLGKTLYRMEDALLNPDIALAASAADTTSTALSSAVTPAATGALAVAPARVGAVVSASKVINRFSQTLHWDIDGLDVLVGVDTPIVLDRRDNTEQVLKLEDMSERMSPADMQRDALNCWFDATLANVPQVGIYIHNAGVVQSFEVKKVQELLGLVEGRIATVAMNFTSNVLQWLVKQCDKDDGSYVVFRSFNGDYLDLYELPSTAKTADPLASFMDDEGTSSSVGGDVRAGGHGMASTATPSPSASKKERAEQQHEYEKMHLNLARMCFGMGKHLFEEVAIDKAQDAINLLLRSFAIFLQQPEAVGAIDRIDDISGMLPTLVGRLLQQRHLSAATAARPEDFRDALVTCGRFESRLRLALSGEALDPVTHRRCVRCLLPCSAALCVVVARTLDAVNACRCECVNAGLPLCRGRQCILAAAEPSDVDRSPRGPAKDLLQVVVESLVRLEQVNAAVTHFVNVQQQEKREQQAHGAPNAAVSAGHKAITERTTATQKTRKRRHGAAREAARAGEDGTCLALIDPVTEIDLSALNASLAELFGDLVLIAMSDRSTFTVRVLQEVSRRIAGRASAEGSTRQQQQQQQAASRQNNIGAAAGLKNGAALAVPTTLQWLASLPTDTVSLSFTALRFYKSAGASTARLLLKMGQVSFLVGRYYARTDRYTKALEALHRAKSLFRASESAHQDTRFGECFCSAPLVTLSDVLRALGDVYTRMAELKLHASAAVSKATLTASQPLSIGALHVCGEDEAKFLQQAVACYAEGGWYRQQAVLQLRAVSAEIDSLTLAGTPASSEAATRLHATLAELKRKDSDSVSRSHRLQLEWEALRLFTCTAAGAAPDGLVKDAREVSAAWAQRLSGSLMIVGPDGPPLSPLMDHYTSSQSLGSSPMTPGGRTATAPSSPSGNAAATGGAAVSAWAPPEKAQLASVPHDKGFTVSLWEQNLQLGLAHCVAAEAGAGEQTLKHARLVCNFVVAALDTAAPGVDEAAHLATLARVWDANGIEGLVQRVGGMMVGRALKAVVAAASSNEEGTRVPLLQQRGEEAARLLGLLADSGAQLPDTDSTGPRQPLRAVISPVRKW